jgi:threonine dehydratase
VRFTAVISDRPGGLADLASTLARCGASVRDILHERTFAEPDVSKVMVQCIVEVRDRDHSEELFRALEERGVRVISRG